MEATPVGGRAGAIHQQEAAARGSRPAWRSSLIRRPGLSNQTRRRDLYGLYCDWLIKRRASEDVERPQRAVFNQCDLVAADDPGRIALSADREAGLMCMPDDP